MAKGVNNSPPTTILWCRARVLATPCGFCGRQIRVWVRFFGVSPIFPCHESHSSILPLSPHSFCFIRYCDGATGVVGRLPYYSQTSNIGTLYISLLCPRAGLSLQTQAPRLQFCPKAGVPYQTREPRLQFY